MHFYATLQEQTQAERDYLLAAPIIGRALRGEVGLDSYLAFLATEHRIDCKCVAGDLVADVPAEELTDALTLAKSAQHLVETDLEDTHLGAVVDRHSDVGVSAAHAVDGVNAR